MKQVSKEIESSIIELINKRMNLIEAGETKSDDLLGILLESNHNEMQQNGNGSGMSFKDVVEECKLFYIAGQETTSSLLVWTMILLSTHPDWQERAREEVLQVCGSEKPNFQELNQLKTVSYTLWCFSPCNSDKQYKLSFMLFIQVTMIFHEVLRLYAPTVMLARTIHNETKLGNFTLPAGMQFFLATILLHYDPKYWGDDAKEFRPERFCEGIAKATKGQSSYFPFGGGPRICIGQNFAMLEVKMALAMILQKYSFKLSPSYAHSPDMAIVALEPQYGAQLILQKI